MQSQNKTNSLLYTNRDSGTIIPNLKKHYISNKR